MKLTKMRCPGCGASIKLEEELDVFFCKYCGEEIIVSGLSKAELDAKVRIKELKHKESMKDKKYAYKRSKMELETKNGIKITLLVIGILLFCMIIVGLLMLFGEVGVKKQEKELQAIVEEIQMDIDNQNFNEAYIKANLLYWDDSYTDDGEEKWDNIRKEILKQIKEAEKEANKEKKDAEEKEGIFDFIKNWKNKD